MLWERWLLWKADLYNRCWKNNITIGMYFLDRWTWHMIHLLLTFIHFPVLLKRHFIILLISPYLSEFKIVDSNYFLFSNFLSSHLLFPFSVVFIFGDLGLGSRWHHCHISVTWQMSQLCVTWKSAEGSGRIILDSRLTSRQIHGYLG